MEETQIDFVVTWLDSLDPIWQELLAIHKPGSKGDASKARFRGKHHFPALLGRFNHQKI